ncbi:unnamed protein product [Cylicocyclus nassatus]|uniref:Uncharacterized protein n=1 Tax=Cylicocyclus nassatus TaxID=53992 RepID=A0AA36DNK1_CYLNA|nr:unnamed protein product [Cylicocyclus nassatus]
MVHDMLVTLFILITPTVALPRLRDPFDVPEASHSKPLPNDHINPFFTFNEDEIPRMAPVDLDEEVEIAPKKKVEKLPMQKILKHHVFNEDRPIPDVMPALPIPKSAEFLEPQPGVAPKFTGSVEKEPSSTSGDFDYFNFGEGEGPVTNPAATYLAGGDFEKVSAPKCTMLGCTGPLPNDGSFSIDPPKSKGKSCHQTFVPMNGCTNNKGYPMGMLCSICCDCTASFIREMKKTHGYKINYPA